MAIITLSISDTLRDRLIEHHGDMTSVRDWTQKAWQNDLLNTRLRTLWPELQDSLAKTIIELEDESLNGEE